MNKKVLFLVNHDIVIYNFRKELVERLLSEGYDVYISSPYGERIEDLIKMGCHYIDTKVDRHGINPIKDLFLIKLYKKIIKQIKPKVVLTYTIKPNIYGGIAAKKYNIPYIANITGLGTAVEKKGILQFITILMYKYAFQKIQTVFLQNQENMDFFKNKKIANDKLKLLPGSGVNLDHFKLLEYPPDDTIDFVFISRIMKEKGIDLYLEAAQFITKKYPNTKFHVCGFCEEEYEDKLKEYQDKGYIIYHGMVRDIREILKFTHCTIHPSYYPEGLSNVLLESAACGRPIITTNRSGCREVVKTDINGYLVYQNNYFNLIEKIEVFLNLNYKNKIKMGYNSRKFVEKNFDRQIVVNSYINELEGIT